MKPWELFKLIEDTEYISGGDDVQFAVKPVEEEKAIYLLFQESTSKRDWQVNLDFPVKVYKQQQKFFLVHQEENRQSKEALMVLKYFVKYIEQIQYHQNEALIH